MFTEHVQVQCQDWRKISLFSSQRCSVAAHSWQAVIFLHLAAQDIGSVWIFHIGWFESSWVYSAGEINACTSACTEEGTGVEMCTPPGSLMDVVEQRLHSRCQSPAAHKGGKSLTDTWRFLLSGPLAPCKAVLQSMDLLLDLMLMESGWWRGLHNSPPFLWLTAWPPWQFDLRLAQREGHTILQHLPFSLSITQGHRESLGLLVGATH